MIVNQVYDNNFINEAGFLTEELYFSDIISNDTQEVLFNIFEDESTKPEHYKEVMLGIMFELIDELEEEDKIEGQANLDKTVNTYRAGD